MLATRGDTTGAAMAAQRAAALDPQNERALGQLVSTLTDGRNEPALAQLTGILLASKPGRPVTMYAEMSLSGLRGDFTKAAALGERLTGSGGDTEDAARYFNLLGLAYQSIGNYDGARRALEASLKIAPRAAATMLNLAYTELRGGRPGAAEKRFSEALFVYPTLAPALNGLAEAREAQK